MAYEKTGYDKTGPGRLPDLLDEWSVRRLKEVGADCIKILLYYTPDDPKDVNDRKHAWVERIGDECRANDIPFFLEFIGYEEGADEKGLDFARKKPRIVAGSMAEFTKDRYGVDVMKVEMPINMKFVEGARVFGGQTAYTKQEAMDHFRRTAEVATRPFIYLSAGVSNAEFTESLDLAAEAGTRFSGVLCGRATWKDGIPVFGKQGGAAFRSWLEKRRREEHRERERAPEAGASVVRVLRGEVRRRAQVGMAGAVGRPPPVRQLRFRTSMPLTLPRQVSPEYGTRTASIADLRRAGQRDAARRQVPGHCPFPAAAQRIVEPISVPCAVPAA